MSTSQREVARGYTRPFAYCLPGRALLRGNASVPCLTASGRRASLLEIFHPRRQPHFGGRAIERPVETTGCQQAKEKLQEDIPDRSRTAFLGANGRVYP